MLTVAGVAALAVGAGIVIAPWALSIDFGAPKSKVSVATDPAESLPDAEREAAYKAQLAAHTEARNEFIAEFETAARSVAGLQQVELNALPVSPQPTLAAALASSELVVRVVVDDLTFTPEGTIASLVVNEVLQGSAPADLRTVIGGGPEPDRTFTTGVLAIDPAMPFLFEGTEAVLLLEAEPAGSPMPAPFSVQSLTGTYLVDAAGAVTAHEGNPFKASVDGMAIGAFTDLLRRSGT